MSGLVEPSSGVVGVSISVLVDTLIVGVMVVVLVVPVPAVSRSRPGLLSRDTDCPVQLDVCG